MDKTVLVIPQPGTKSTLYDETVKVLGPFSPGVWILILFIIAVTAVLSVWFSPKTVRRRSAYKKCTIYARLVVDEWLEKATVRPIVLWCYCI